MASLRVNKASANPIAPSVSALIQAVHGALGALGRGVADATADVVIQKFKDQRKIVVYLDDLDRGWHPLHS